jgi:hypothetical protein
MLLFHLCAPFSVIDTHTHSLSLSLSLSFSVSPSPFPSHTFLQVVHGGVLGHVLRTKMTDDDGGMSAGLAVLDSPYLV